MILRRRQYKAIVPLIITAVYDVNSTTSATKICVGTTNFSALEIDGVAQPRVVENYTFSTTGEHTVKLTLSKKAPKSLKGGFYDCSRLKRITLPDGLETISDVNDNVFYSCNLLKNLIIPDSVTQIKGNLLSYCLGITSLNIPKNVNYIYMGSSGIIKGCRNLTSITVDTNNLIYDSRNNCNGIIETATNTLIAGINNTTIPNSVTKLGPFCYNGLYNYSSTFVIPSNITEISERSFVGAPVPSFTVDVNNPVYDSRDNCGAIIETATNTLVKAGTQMTTIPSTVTAIGPWALESSANSSGPKVSTIPNSITSIGEYAFYYYGSALSPSERDLVIPNSVTTIGHMAFGSAHFKSITILSNLSIINPTVFYSIRLLETVILPNTVTEIGQQAFSAAEKLSSIDLSNVITIGNMAFQGCSTLASVNLSSASEIGHTAFGSCSSLATVSIGNNLISVGVNAFNGCTSLPVSNNIRYADTIAAEVIDKTQTSYTLRTDTTHIISRLFTNNTNITTIDIPSSVSYIGSDVFNGCRNLSSVTVLATTPPTLGSNAFYNTSTNLKIYVPSGSVDAYKTASGWSRYASKIYAIPE